MTQPKVLFIVKYRENKDGSSSYCENEGKGFSSGLYNSARFIVEMLTKTGIEAKLVEVIDNNCIDREVTEFKPTHCIIEAFWVVPEKFQVLCQLHPDVKWVIRNHSELPFLAHEGIAVDWLCEYVQYPNVFVSGNSPRVNREIEIIIGSANPDWSQNEIRSKVWYLPNYYPLHGFREYNHSNDGVYIDIGCFSAVRPLKNHLLQAVAAIAFADKLGLKLRFHINGSRVENNGDQALKNLRNLFKHSKNHELIEHPWLCHDEFLDLLASMDIGMQVTLTETFNIVAADMVYVDLPIVVSPEISWASNLSKANPNSSKDIVKVLSRVWRLKNLGLVQYLNLKGLKYYNLNSEVVWLDNLYI